MSGIWCVLHRRNNNGRNDHRRSHPRRGPRHGSKHRFHSKGRTIDRRAGHYYVRPMISSHVYPCMPISSISHGPYGHHHYEYSPFPASFAHSWSMIANPVDSDSNDGSMDEILDFGDFVVIDVDDKDNTENEDEHGQEEEEEEDKTDGGDKNKEKSKPSVATAAEKESTEKERTSSNSSNLKEDTRKNVEVVSQENTTQTPKPTTGTKTSNQSDNDTGKNAIEQQAATKNSATTTNGTRHLQSSKIVPVRTPVHHKETSSYALISLDVSGFTLDQLNVRIIEGTTNPKGKTVPLPSSSSSTPTTLMLAVSGRRTNSIGDEFVIDRKFVLKRDQIATTDVSKLAVQASLSPNDGILSIRVPKKA